MISSENVPVTVNFPFFSQLSIFIFVTLSEGGTISLFSSFEKSIVCDNADVVESALSIASSVRLGLASSADKSEEPRYYHYFLI